MCANKDRTTNRVEQKASETSSPIRDCVAMAQNLTRVILNEVKNLDLSIGSERRDPSATPQDDIATQSLKGGRNGIGIRTLSVDTII